MVSPILSANRVHPVHGRLSLDAEGRRHLREFSGGVGPRRLVYQRVQVTSSEVPSTGRNLICSAGQGPPDTCLESRQAPPDRRHLGGERDPHANGGAELTPGTAPTQPTTRPLGE